jgi:hypothetical protein
MDWSKFKDPILVQAVIAGALSFSHIHDLAEMMGQEGWRAWAYPVSVDLLMIMAWKKLRTPDAPKGWPWVWFLLALGASLSANMATSDIHDPMSVAVAAWPVLAFLGGSFMVHARSVVEDGQEAEPVPVEDQEDQEEPEESDQLVTVVEAHNLTGINIHTIRTWVGRGQLDKLDKRGRANLVSLKAVRELENA